MVLVTQAVPGLLRVRGAENWLRFAKMPAGAHGQLVRLERRRRDVSAAVSCTPEPFLFVGQWE
jgi:hypothetical protein